MPEAQTYDQVKARLDEIVEAVGADELPLEKALDLYEEAVRLGMQASDLIEKDIEARDASGSEDEGAEGGDSSGEGSPDGGPAPAEAQGGNPAAAAGAEADAAAGAPAAGAGSPFGA